jgi:hypothetical protein
MADDPGKVDLSLRVEGAFLDDPRTIRGAAEDAGLDGDAFEGWLTDEARAGANWRRLLIATDAHDRREGDLLSGLNLVTLVQWWESEHPTASWAERHGGRAIGRGHRRSP